MLETVYKGETPLIDERFGACDDGVGYQRAAAGTGGPVWSAEMERSYSAGCDDALQDQPGIPALYGDSTPVEYEQGHQMGAHTLREAMVPDKERAAARVCMLKILAAAGASIGQGMEDIEPRWRNLPLAKQHAEFMRGCRDAAAQRSRQP
ncbi:hypothetical protein ADK90_23910 [Streptomyces sp. XY413]|uniref:hypothetical protein n=1 Tax=Streptomyces sp. XY413 TaxID=1519479 RepID=UPI0006ADEEE5|nr:hypothetical protein [Streptomyces sp. XY413]KOV17613.1 hypothetical protein ADK90_23910 [Streptomyces sp. XY413]